MEKMMERVQANLGNAQEKKKSGMIRRHGKANLKLGIRCWSYFRHPVVNCRNNGRDHIKFSSK